MAVVETQQNSADARSRENSREASSHKLASGDPLWTRIETFELDVPMSGLNFTERLARENVWSLGYTKRVISEYKRFLYMAKRAGHVVCPSDAVDQAWHMHLTFTRSYWDELCGEVLESPLHHGPSRGGSQEKERYYQLYEKTQETYLGLFGAEPPEDIWPEPRKRFGEDLNFVRINSASHWILPKLGMKRLAIGGGAAGVAIPVAQVALNPLEWTGQSFLILFGACSLVALIVSLVGRHFVFSDRPGAEDGSGDIEPVEAAWLEGGDVAAVRCALVDLANDGAVQLEGSNVKEGPGAREAEPTGRIQQLLLNSVVGIPEGKSWTLLLRESRTGLIALRQRLEEKGLASSNSQISTNTALALMTVGAVMILGAAKIYIGFDRERPVGVLLLIEIALGAAMLGLIASAPRVTSAGKRMLQRLREKMQTQGSSGIVVDAGAADKASSTHRNDDLLLWGAALMGTQGLIGTGFEGYGDFTKPVAGGSAGSGGCGATGCGGDAGAGGDGGGCGGGCGGCGGCGG